MIKNEMISNAFCGTLLLKTANRRKRKCSACTDSGHGIRTRGSRVLCCTRISTNNLRQKCSSSRVQCCVMVVHALDTKNQQQFGKKMYFVASPEYRNLDNLQAEPLVFGWKLFSQRTQRRSFVQDVQKLMEDDFHIHPQTMTASC